MGAAAGTRNPEPGTRNPIPDDLARIIESEIRKDLQGFEREGELCSDPSDEEGNRRLIESTHDRSRPALCPRLEVVVRPAASPAKARTLLRDTCRVLADDGVFHARRRGPRRKLDPAWLFRQAYIRERSCDAIGAETGHPKRCVVEMARRLSRDLERELLVALALPPDIGKSIRDGAPVDAATRELVLERLQAFATGARGIA